MKFAIALIIVFGSMICIRTLPDVQISGSALADSTGKNPNGSSELAILMREMQSYTKQAKANLQAGLKPAPYPKAFDKIYTAKITEDMTKSDFYNQFADLYVMSVKNYSTSKPEQRIETYNNMVSACLACHSQHCPGPVPAIKKMTWDVK